MRWTVCLLASLLLCVTVRAQIQPLTIASNDDQDDSQQKKGGFSVHKEDQKIIDAFDEFHRYSEKKAWDRAFKSLGVVIDTAKNSMWMVPLRDGFWVPTRQRVAESLMTLPPEGKSAYRLFYDADAKKLWDQCQADETAGKRDDLDQLRSLVDRYLITTIGDQAADRLGDALMEKGDYLAAAQAYNLVLTARPDSEMPAVRLLAKRAVALIRGGQVTTYKELAAQIREKHAGEVVHIGGKQMAVEQFLDQLEKGQKSSTTQSSSSDASAESTGPIALPSGQPLWQEVFSDSQLGEKLEAAVNNMGWGQIMGGMGSSAPAVVADEHRVYLNWYGVVWAINIDNGKIAWWSQPFNDIANQAQMLVQSMADQRRFAIAIAGDNLITVALRLDRLNNQEPYRLNCLDPATGKSKWSSEKKLGNQAFLGAPLIVDDTIYVIGHPRESQALSLLAVKLSSGDLVWSSELGQPQTVQGWNGMPMYPVPVLRYDQGFVYVMTNNGATMAVNTGTHAIAWSYSYEVPYQPQNENGMVMWGGMWVQQGMMSASDPGSAVLHEGQLIFKGGGQSDMYAIDLAGPKLAFKRAVDDDQNISCIDDSGFYLIGSYFSFIDPKSRQLLWAPPLPTEQAHMQRALKAGDEFLVFTGRGIYQIDPQHQRTQVFRGADLDSVGGALLHVKNKLISVSNRAVTAYEIGPQTSAR